MSRDTSLEAYEAIRASGALGEMQLEVYAAVLAYGPATSGEIFARMQEGRPPSALISQTRARFTELREMGVIEEDGERPCRISGRNAIVWQVSGNLPTRRKATKRISRKELEAMVERLKVENAKLKANRCACGGQLRLL